MAAAQLENPGAVPVPAPLESVDGGGEDRLQQIKTLVGALNLVSRNLPLPPDVLAAVSSIYDRRQAANCTTMSDGDSSGGVLISQFEDALENQQLSCTSGSLLRNWKENRMNSSIQHRLKELEGLSSNLGEDLQLRCLLELYGLKLLDLQKKVRSEVSLEYWLQEKCAMPEKQLYDWGMMRLRNPYIMYGVGDTFAMEADDRMRKKRDAERLLRIEEEEKNIIETKKRKFFAEILNMAREFQLQGQAILKRRKLRNDGIQAWHGRQRQRATRAEKLRLQALKADDQEAYMRMVEESKNERLTMFLGETNELLVRLGAAVQKQKDAEHVKDTNGAELPDVIGDTEIIDADSTLEVKSNDLLEGQRQYNSAVHSIQEKVTEQPAMLQGGELRPYQLEGLQWMLSLFNNNLNGILADEMGLGKTIQTISLIAYLIEKKGVSGPHLVIAPKAVLPNWASEFSTWAPSIAAILYDGRLEERKVLREQCSGEGKFNVMITHYDLIMRDKAFLKKINWHYMIVDEGHRLKNHECSLARTLVTGYQVRRRLLLTGTPIQNNLQELWALLNFLLPSIFNSVHNFEEWFNAPFADKCEVSLTDEEELLIINRLHHVIRPFLLRRKKDEVEKFLPGKTQVILKCDLSAWQKLYYQQVTDKKQVGVDSGNGRSRSLQNLSMHLRKCCNHPYLFVPDYFWRKEDIARASGKFELLDRLLPKLQKTGHRVLLFSQMTQLINILEIYLKLHDYKYLRLDGSTKTEERGTLLKKFNAPDSPYFMFLLSTRAGGLGLNLQTADTVIIFDSDWNPQMDQQAEDRAHRIGQKKEVRVFVLVSVGSIEEVILERAKQKMGIDAKVIQAGLFNTTSTAQDRREMLQDIMQRGTDLLGTDVPSEREINRLAARSDEEYWMFQKMDEDRQRREGYRSRLMEEHEVPEWAYSVNEEDKNKKPKHDMYSTEVTGKRRRKEVIYADTLSDTQWVKALEDGEDFSKFSTRSKRRTHLLDDPNLASDILTEQNTPDQKYETRSVGSEEMSDDFVSQASRRPSSSILQSNNTYDDDDDDGGDDDCEGPTTGSWCENDFSWKTHKRKRSNHVVVASSSDYKGRFGP